MRNVLYLLTVAVARCSSEGSAVGLSYILPVLWTTSCLAIISHAKATMGKNDVKGNKKRRSTP